jgi:hypothetical protein
MGFIVQASKLNDQTLNQMSILAHKLNQHEPDVSLPNNQSWF